MILKIVASVLLANGITFLFLGLAAYFAPDEPDDKDWYGM